ncbi:MAG: 30S ribosomal protein S6 [Christensenellaceae bacterium]|jgi:small subunit ribosomal protein S6|nr:30S ribosomal protein S6 [Christensenellaceae bacterium]
MKKSYEVLYILDAKLEEAKREELIEKFAKMAGDEVSIEKQGVRKFARPLNYKKEGFYVLMNFNANEHVPNEISALMNITDGVLRYMFTQKTDVMREHDDIKKNRKPQVRPEKQEEIK